MTLGRSAPLRRTPFKHKPLGQREPLLKSTKMMKARGPKMTPIRRAARGQECTLRISGVCNFDPSTVVLCHSNRLADGKGMGLKATDTAACFGCSACHDVLDGRRPRPEGITKADIEGAFCGAVQLTHVILREKGLMP